MTPPAMTSSAPHKLGAHFTGDGVDFAVFSKHARKVELCLFSPDGKTETARIKLPEKTGPVWHGHLPGLAPGALYGFRAHGQYAPHEGHRFNPKKLLLDPYTHEMQGQWTENAALYGYDLKHTDKPSTLDSAGFVPKSVVSDPTLLAPVSRNGEMAEGDLIYEAHVKGLTMEYPGVPDPLRGTYEALCSDAMIDHLQDLGVRSLELLPVHSFIDEAFLKGKGLRNYWGYNSIGFFAPEPRYFGPEGLYGFRAMVRKLKDAGISVILDVVYNHTAEGNERGPTLSYRGLDNASYYRLIAGQPALYVNDAGTGNTLDVAHPYVLRMIMDSLRWWVTSMGVDGFRFDLATSLGREAHGFDRHGGFFDALRQDPVLASVQLIAEPWDLGPGGYQLGGFPHEFREWNDRYRDTLRRYWKGDHHSAQELAACLLGSADRFDHAGRSASASLNFVTAHDGFTLADLTTYNHRHNAANTENNRDGHHTNHSDNCGVEGPIDDPAINATRARRRRNILATLFLSQGTPMLLAGDEIGNSQGGNNNAYCQDNPIGWINWEKADRDLQAFVVRLSAFRRDHPVSRQRPFLHAAVRKSDDEKDVAWTDFDGLPLEWRDPGLSSFCLTLRGAAHAPDFVPDPVQVFAAFNRDPKPSKVTLPKAPHGQHWVREIDTADPDAPAAPVHSKTAPVADHSVVFFTLKPRPE